MTNRKRVSGAARGSLRDPAEDWLKNSDPAYVSTKRDWTVPSSDMLARALSANNEVHSTLADLAKVQPGDTGAYRHRAALLQNETGEHEQSEEDQE
jgi:hypothetical protein